MKTTDFKADYVSRMRNNNQLSAMIGAAMDTTLGDTPLTLQNALQIEDYLEVNETAHSKLLELAFQSRHKIHYLLKQAAEVILSRHHIPTRLREQLSRQFQLFSDALQMYKNGEADAGLPSIDIRNREKLEQALQIKDSVDEVLNIMATAKHRGTTSFAERNGLQRG